MDLVFATNNEHKISEIEGLLNSQWSVLSLKEVGVLEDIPETGQTLEENALQKARFVYQHLGSDCFADDTGLEIEALDGAPGVLSARYAGPGRSSEKNMQKVLEQMAGSANRKARFRTVVALIRGGEEWLFEGIVEGIILNSPIGEGGFGYDPIFKPVEAEISFAQMPLSEKNKISHRARAVKKLVDYLDSLPLNDNKR
jgi:XTP/dITP diphosphohydrolase